MASVEPKISKKSAGDWVHALVKGSIGLVPGVGNVAAEVFGLVLAPPVPWRAQKGSGPDICNLGCCRLRLSEVLTEDRPRGRSIQNSGPDPVDRPIGR
jgi:hypothetical protein